MHFTIEHLYGHHRKVSTPEDPASAPKNMSLYEFFPRTIVGGFRSAWRINPQQTGLTVLGSVVFVGLVYRIFGPIATLYQLAVALGSICYLEITNYIEHCGLQRKRLADGAY
jgi:alkane 1-monooxygenase